MTELRNFAFDNKNVQLKRKELIMKKIFAMCFALVAMGAASYAAESNMMQDKKEAKTECKAGAKKACKKGAKKCCKKGDKKAGEKSCCSKKAK